MFKSEKMLIVVDLFSKDAIDEKILHEAGNKHSLRRSSPLNHTRREGGREGEREGGREGGSEGGRVTYRGIV